MDDEKISSLLGIRKLSEVDNVSNSEVVDIVEAEEVYPTPSVVLPEEDENVRDIELARQNVKNIIEQGDEALREMIDLAKQSESPRAFEVASTLMKTLLDANKDFVEMSSKKKFAKEELMGVSQKNDGGVTNNNLIITTADLLKMLKDESNE